MSQKVGKKMKRRVEEEHEVTKKDSLATEKIQKNENESRDESGLKEPELNGKDDSIASNTRSHSSPQNKKDASTELKAETELKANAETELKANAETELKANAATELKTNAETELKANIETDNVKEDAKQDESSAESDVEVKKSKSEIDDEPQVKKIEEINEGKIVEVESVVVEKCVVTEIEEAANQENESVNPPASTEHEELSEVTKSENVELEPLIIEGEEPDPELQFDESSDVDSRKSSPIIRCRTRRSLTRNIPTPKTPKSFLDTNGEDTQGSDKQLGFTLEDEPGNIEIKEISGGVSKLCESFESISNISTKAVVGSDVTRNMDFSCSAFQDHEYSPFLSVSKDRSVGETLRHLSSRRAIRPVKDYQKMILQLNQEKKSKKKTSTLAPPLPPGRPSVERISGIKRKSHSQTPDNMKRFKPDSPGLFSYISSPIQSIKNHFVKSDIPSSTPKLTGYKNKTIFDNSDVSKICLDMTLVDNTERKWCTIM